MQRFNDYRWEGAEDLKKERKSPADDIYNKFLFKIIDSMI